MTSPRGFLLDLDGTLYTDAGAITGGPGAIGGLRRRRVPFRCVTNTTTRSRRGLVQRMASLGYDISAEEIFTPIVAASAVCRLKGYRKVVTYLPDGAQEDLIELEMRAGGNGGATPDAIVVGDLGEQWSFPLMQEAFSHLQSGAAFVALSRDRFYLKQNVLTLDAGAFVAGLEFASGRPATVVGKPSPDFYRGALASLGLQPADVAMVGDDLWSDVEGAQKAGLMGWLVRTGKFREELLRESGVVPDKLLTSIAELVVS